MNFTYWMPADFYSSLTTNIVINNISSIACHYLATVSFESEGFYESFFFSKQRIQYMYAIFIYCVEFVYYIIRFTIKVVSDEWKKAQSLR